MAWGTRRKRSFRGRRSRDRLHRQRIMRGVFFGMAIALALVSVWFGTRHAAVTITTIEVRGVKTIDPNVVTQKSNAALEGTYALLVPKRFSYTYPEDAVVNAVESLARVRSASVERTSRNELTVTLEEYMPHALWCTEVDAAHACLLVSAEGVAYRNAPLLEGSTFLRYVTEGRDPAVGTQFASAAYVQITEEFAEALKQEHGMHVYAVIETVEGDVRYRVRGGGELLVTRDANVQDVFENLESILASEEFAHIEPGNFAYIDLRFGNKVYVHDGALAENEKPDTAATMNAPDEDAQAAMMIAATESEATTTATTTSEGNEDGGGE